MLKRWKLKSGGIEEVAGECGAEDAGAGEGLLQDGLGDGEFGMGCRTPGRWLRAAAVIVFVAHGDVDDLVLAGQCLQLVVCGMRAENAGDFRLLLGLRKFKFFAVRVDGYQTNVAAGFGRKFDLGPDDGVVFVAVHGVFLEPCEEEATVGTCTANEEVNIPDGLGVAFLDVPGPDGTNGQMFATEYFRHLNSKNVGAFFVIVGDGGGIEAEEQEAAGIGRVAGEFHAGEKMQDAADGIAAGVGDDDGAMLVDRVGEQAVDAGGDDLGGATADGVAAKSSFVAGGFDVGDVVVVDDMKLLLAAEFFGERELEGFVDGRGEAEQVLFGGKFQESCDAAEFARTAVAVDCQGNFLGALAFVCDEERGAVGGTLRGEPMLIEERVIGRRGGF